MNKVKLNILGLSSSQTQTGYTLILGEHKGMRRLPIVIGIFEAQAIAIEIEKITPTRPLTHDLFKSFAQKFNYSIEEIIISDFKEGVFYAKIFCKGISGKIIEIDSRPSDAVALALRFKAEVYAYETIMSEASIILPQDDFEYEDSEEDDNEDSQADTQGSPYKDTSYETLQEMLEKALENEEYEQAARIRDEINKRN